MLLIGKMQEQRPLFVQTGAAERAVGEWHRAVAALQPAYDWPNVRGVDRASLPLVPRLAPEHMHRGWDIAKVACHWFVTGV